MNIASRDSSLWNKPIFNKPSFHAVEETRDLIWASWCGIHNVVFPTLFRWVCLITMPIFLSFSCTWQAFLKHISHALGGQPAYLSEKNRPAFPCHTLTSEDDNLLSRNISNNCLENRCLSGFTCNWLSLPCPCSARALLSVPWSHSSLPPQPGTRLWLVLWQDPEQMFPLRMTCYSILHTTRKLVLDR